MNSRVPEQLLGLQKLLVTAAAPCVLGRPMPFPASCVRLSLSREKEGEGGKKEGVPRQDCAI